MKQDDTTHLQQLGSNKTRYISAGPNAADLEVFDNQFPESPYEVEHVTEEFTSLCPKTGQPDFATIRIRFWPGSYCVESKSLKLYLFSFRNVGSFMETIVNTIKDDLLKALGDPIGIEVKGFFKSRGGIATTVTARHQNALSDYTVEWTD